MQAKLKQIVKNSEARVFLEANPTRVIPKCFGDEIDETLISLLKFGEDKDIFIQVDAIYYVTKKEILAGEPPKNLGETFAEIFKRNVYDRIADEELKIKEAKECRKKTGR